MKIAAIAAVVLFCVAPATKSDAQCFRGSCSIGSSLAIGQGVAIQNVVQPVVQTRVRNGLFGRTIIRSKVRNQVVQQAVSVPTVSTVSSFVQQPSFVQLSAFPAVLQSFANYGAFGSYAGGYGTAFDEDAYLNARLREEIGELVERKEIISELKDRLGL